MKKYVFALLIALAFISNTYAIKPIDYCYAFLSRTMNVEEKFIPAIVNDYRNYLVETLGYISDVPLYKDYANAREAFDRNKIKIKVITKLDDYDAYECVIHLIVSPVVYETETYKQCRHTVGKYCDKVTRSFVNENYDFYFNVFVDRSGNVLQGVFYVMDMNGNIIYAPPLR